MLRTSLYLPTTLHQRLVITAQQERKTLSKLVTDLLDKALTYTERTHLEHMYAELQKLDGIGPKGLADVSQTIDDTLYGKQGTWRGELHAK
jgi:hypothetical protein